ncbi:hypothetical protein F0562_025480 [Nyssa sinensis]|uniref:Uncharacterized protein n=1 Tax=Nyssa sinensis TaxID=561372 RepID=A0A5J5B832_9ASTE|nr:hypothetical protein F0562_025480 [Nyssa sinensis]
MTVAYDLEDGEVFACTPRVAAHDFSGGRKMGGPGRGEAGARAEHAGGHLSYPPPHQPSPNAERRRAQVLLDRMPVNAVLHQNTQVVELVRSFDASYPSTPMAGSRDIQKTAQPTAITSNANAPSSTVTNQKAYNLAGTPLTIAQCSEWGPHSTPSVPSASHETATSLTLPVIKYIHSGPHQLSPSNPIVADRTAYPSISMAGNSSNQIAAPPMANPIVADIVAYPSILTVGTSERDPHPTPYVSHETTEIQSYPTGAQSIDPQRGGGPPLLTPLFS